MRDKRAPERQLVAPCRGPSWGNPSHWVAAGAYAAEYGAASWTAERADRVNLLGLGSVSGRQRVIINQFSVTLQDSRDSMSVTAV